MQYYLINGLIEGVYAERLVLQSCIFVVYYFTGTYVPNTGHYSFTSL